MLRCRRMRLRACSRRQDGCAAAEFAYAVRLRIPGLRLWCRDGFCGGEAAGFVVAVMWPDAAVANAALLAAGGAVCGE